MTSWHKQTVSKCVNKLNKKFEVVAPCNLPIRKRPEALYQPDIVAFDRKTGEIKYIIEVQTKNVRKSIMGAAILAHIFMRDYKPRSTPKLIFILQNTSNKEEIRKLKLRLDKMSNLLKKSYLSGRIELMSLYQLLKG